MKKTLAELADYLGGRVIGDPAAEVAGLASLDDAVEGTITFLANPKYAHKVKHTKASAILIGEDQPGLPIARIISNNPYLDFARVLEMFYQPPRPAPGGTRGR